VTRGLVALGMAISLVAGAEPAKKKDKPKPPDKQEHEDGRSKRAEITDYDPASAPVRKVGKKVIRLSAIEVEGRIDKPLVYIDAVPPLVRAPRFPRAMLDPRELAYVVLRAAPSLEAASALLCPVGKVLPDCDGAGLDVARAAYAWFEVGRTLGATDANVAERAFARASAAPALATVASYEHAVALARLDRNTEAARAFEDTRAHAGGDDVIATNALAWTAIAIGSEDPGPNAGQPVDVRTAIERVAAMLAGRERAPARAQLLARVAELRFDMADYPSAIALARASLATAPLAAEAPRWHALVVRAYGYERSFTERDAEQAIFDRAYAEDSQWFAANKAEPAAMKSLADSKVSPPASDVSGGLDQGAVLPIVERHGLDLRVCAHGASLSATLHLTVGSAGDVRAASVTGAPSDIGACISRFAQSWVFPRPDDGEAHADISLRIVR
jgi:hypothetical protein